MSLKTFLTAVSVIAFSIGAFALVAPATLLSEVKHADAGPAAAVMARTVGVLLISVALLNFRVRAQPNSAALRGVLVMNIFLQLALLPIDMSAYFAGTFRTLGSFLPNTLLHGVLAAAFAFYLYRLRAAEKQSPPASSNPLAA